MATSGGRGGRRQGQQLWLEQLVERLEKGSQDWNRWLINRDFGFLTEEESQPHEEHLALRVHPDETRLDAEEDQGDGFCISKIGLL